MILEGNSRLHGDRLSETFEREASLYVQNNPSQRLRNFKTPSKGTVCYILRWMHFFCGGTDIDNPDDLPLKVNRFDVLEIYSCSKKS